MKVKLPPVVPEIDVVAPSHVGVNEKVASSLFVVFTFNVVSFTQRVMLSVTVKVYDP